MKSSMTVISRRSVGFILIVRVLNAFVSCLRAASRGWCRVLGLGVGVRRSLRYVAFSVGLLGGMSVWVHKQSMLLRVARFVVLVAGVALCIISLHNIDIGMVLFMLGGYALVLGLYFIWTAYLGVTVWESISICNKR